MSLWKGGKPSSNLKASKCAQYGAEMARSLASLLLLLAMPSTCALALRHVSRRTAIQTVAVMLPATSQRARAVDLQEKDPGFFGAMYNGVGKWLTEHPAPMWMVNNPVKRWVTTKAAGDYDRAKTRTTLDAILAGDDVVIFSATYCPFSLAAKKTLEGEGVPFRAVEWNTREDGSALVAELGAMTGRTSIPHIWVGGQYIGGFNDGVDEAAPGLRPLIASGRLGPALQKAALRRVATNSLDLGK